MDDAVALERIREAERLGYKALFLTVDALVPSNRGRDVRAPWVLEEQESGSQFYDENTEEGEVSIVGTAGALITKDDQDMTWERVSLAMTYISFRLLKATTPHRPCPGYGA